MRSLIQIEGVAHGECHAGGKAPSDAAIIAERTGFRCLRVVRQISRNPLLLNLYRLLWIIKSWWYELQIPRRSIVFLQYPGDLFSGRFGVAFFRRILRSSHTDWLST